MTKFMYLFRNRGGTYKPASPEELQRMLQAWMVWIDELKANNHLVQTGERLDDTGAVVRGKSKVVSDGPYAESKDMVGGYLLIQANDLAQATELAKGCPIFELDGMVEVRAVLPR